MTDLTIGIILSVKSKYRYKEMYNLKDSAKLFLVDYLKNRSFQTYTDELMISMLVPAFIEYASENSDPKDILDQYYSYKSYNYYSASIQEEIFCILKTFMSAKIKDRVNGKLVYVNGFHDFSFNELNLSLQEINYYDAY